MSHTSISTGSPCNKKRSDDSTLRLTNMEVEHRLFPKESSLPGDHFLVSQSVVQFPERHHAVAFLFRGPSTSQHFMLVCPLGFCWRAGAVLRHCTLNAMNLSKPQNQWIKKPNPTCSSLQIGVKGDIRFSLHILGDQGFQPLGLLSLARRGCTKSIG